MDFVVIYNVINYSETGKKGLVDQTPGIMGTCETVFAK